MVKGDILIHQQSGRRFVISDNPYQSRMFFTVEISPEPKGSPSEEEYQKDARFHFTVGTLRSYLLAHAVASAFSHQDMTEGSSIWELKKLYDDAIAARLLLAEKEIKEVKDTVCEVSIIRYTFPTVGARHGFDEDVANMDWSRRQYGAAAETIYYWVECKSTRDCMKICAVNLGGTVEVLREAPVAEI